MSNFFNATKINENIDEYQFALIEALETARNADTVSNKERREIRKNRADCASAAISACRLEFATAASNAIEAHFATDDLHHHPDIFFVTLIDRDWLTPARSVIDLERMKQKLRTMVGNRSCFFIIVEPGYYANIQNDLFETRAISWHVHGLMWDIDRPEVRTFVDGINQSSKYKTLIPTRTPAHSRKIKQGDLPRCVGYMAKPPANAYRVLCLRKLHESKERELGIPVDPIYCQRKQALRPGEQIRLFHALKDIDPPDLLTGSGDGRKIISQIKKRLG